MYTVYIWVGNWSEMHDDSHLGFIDACRRADTYANMSRNGVEFAVVSDRTGEVVYHARSSS